MNFLFWKSVKTCILLSPNPNGSFLILAWVRGDQSNRLTSSKQLRCTSIETFMQWKDNVQLWGKQQMFHFNTSEAESLYFLYHLKEEPPVHLSTSASVWPCKDLSKAEAQQYTRVCTPVQCQVQFPTYIKPALNFPEHNLIVGSPLQKLAWIFVWSDLSSVDPGPASVCTCQAKL